MAAKAELWIADPADRYFLANVRMLVEALKAILMGIRNASLLAQAQSTAILTHYCRNNADDKLAFLQKLTTRFSRREPEIDLVLLLDEGALAAGYVALARLFHQRVNLHAFRDAAHLEATLPAIAAKSQIAALRKELAQDVADGPLAFHGEIFAPPVYANTAREHLKTIAPFSRVCALYVGDGWDDLQIIRLHESLARALPRWQFVVFCNTDFVPKGLSAGSLFLPQCRGFLDIGQLAFLLEADAYVGFPGLPERLARLAGKPCHLLNEPREGNAQGKAAEDAAKAFLKATVGK